MPRHNPTTTSTDDGHDRHERRLERDSRARTRRRTRRLQTAWSERLGKPLPAQRHSEDPRDLELQVDDWRTELALLP